MPAYLIYNQLISPNIMIKQDVLNPHFMILIINTHHLAQFSKVHPTKLVFILLNRVILLSIWIIFSLLLLWTMAFTTVLVTTITHQIVFSSIPQLITNIVTHQSIIRHLLLCSINHVPIRHLLL